MMGPDAELTRKEIAKFSARDAERVAALVEPTPIIGAMASPSMPATAYVLFHHVMAEAGAREACGGTCEAAWAAYTRAGGGRPRPRCRLRCDAEVARILVRDGRAAGVALDSGDKFHAWPATPTPGLNAAREILRQRRLRPGRLLER
jgi:phytoene dehydrogenase-like protein